MGKEEVLTSLSKEIKIQNKGSRIMNDLWDCGSERVWKGKEKAGRQDWGRRQKLGICPFVQSDPLKWYRPAFLSKSPLTVCCRSSEKRVQVGTAV